MSEYWVSRKKYFCKYCDIYIADDAPSRNQHENGLRHKGNKERFVRSLYKAGEKRKRDEDEERREMARIERAAEAASAEDVAAGRDRASTSTSTSTKPGPSSLRGSSSSQSQSSSRPSPAAKPSGNPYANYSTPESLGYSDLDAIRHAEEMARKQKEGVVGEWEVVVPTPPVEAEGDSAVEPKQEEDLGRIGLSEEEQTRPADVDEDDTRSFRLRKKTGGLGELYDPGVIIVGKKGDKEKEKEEPQDSTIKKEEAASTAAAVKEEQPGSLFRKRRRKV